MIKSELILRIAAQNSHLYNRDLEKVVNSIFGEIEAALVRRDRVETTRLRCIHSEDQARATGSQSKDWGRNQRPRKAPSYI